MSEPKATILIVDDEEANLHKLRRTFMTDYRVLAAGSGSEALELLREQPVAAIVTDQRMPGMTGVELLARSLEIRPDTVRIILTGYTEVDDLMDAINAGQVHRYITKPWEPHDLRQNLEQELERWELKRENERLARQLSEANRKLQLENRELREEVQTLRDGHGELIYASRAMKDLLALVDRVVDTDATVLIQGETGTGKELLARYIQRHSPRRNGPFVAVNCGAIPADLVESAFFGHRKGAFTGATEDREGYFQRADGGTLFLDEVGESPLELQVKLLRVLQNGEIQRVGEDQRRHIDVRVIASTNRDLGRMVDGGSFRQDLFFRLNVFSIRVPPLRARQEDVEALAQHFLKGLEGRVNKALPGFDAETLTLMRRYSWPGNVRELENEVERLAILCDPGQPVPPSALSERIRYPEPQPDDSGAGLKEQLARLERRLILDALESNDYNKSRTAQALGITRQTIISKLKQYREDSP